MKKAWLVEEGQYDFAVVAIYSNQKDAEEHVKRGGNSYYASEHPFDEPLPEARYHVAMYEDGQVLDADTWPTIDRELGFRGRSGVCALYLCWVVKTGDRQEAIKIVNEKRTQILALGIWWDTIKIKEMIKP